MNGQTVSELLNQQNTNVVKALIGSARRTLVQHMLTANVLEVDVIKKMNVQPLNHMYR